jgi:hypothetical protein
MLQLMKELPSQCADFATQCFDPDDVALPESSEMF